MRVSAFALAGITVLKAAGQAAAGGGCSVANLKGVYGMAMSGFDTA